MSFFGKDKHQHYWTITSRVTHYEDDTDVVEMQCKECGEVKNKSVISQHQHEWEPKALEIRNVNHTEYDMGMWNKFTTTEVLQRCATCHIHRLFELEKTF